MGFYFFLGNLLRHFLSLFAVSHYTVVYLYFVNQKQHWTKGLEDISPGFTGRMDLSWHNYQDKK